MSTSRSEQRKSASFKQESFEQEWAKLAEAARKAETKQKPSVPKLELRSLTGTGSAAKTQEKSAWQANASVPSLSLSTTMTTTTTQTDTTDPSQLMPHSAPVVTPRKQLRFDSVSDAISGSPREKDSPRSEKTTDSPRWNQVRSKESPRGLKVSRSSATSTPSASPAVTPREKNEVESPRSLKAAQFRKNISKKFSKVALDLSRLGEKINTERHSPPSSPGSTGLFSPSKITPRKKESAFIKSLPFAVRNSAAKCLIELQKEDDFISAGPARKKFMLNARLIGVLADQGINADTEKLNALTEDAKTRSENYVFDKKIELGEEPHKSHFMEGAKKFGNSWKKELGMPISEYSPAPEPERQFALENFLSTFIKDYFRRGVSHELQLPDGNSRPFNSLNELANFLNRGNKNSHRSQYISNVTSQNFSIFVQQLACGGLPGTISPVKLYDGSPLIPRGRSEQKYVYSMDDQGVIFVKAKISVFSDNGNDPVRASQIQDDKHTPINIDGDAWLTIESELVFETDDEWSISDLRLRGEGWGLPTEKL